MLTVTALEGNHYIQPEKAHHITVMVIIDGYLGRDNYSASGTCPYLFE